MGRPRASKWDELVDVALQDSFPASDSPAFMAAAATIGAPTRPGAVTQAATASPAEKRPTRARPRKGVASPERRRAVTPLPTPLGASL